MMKKVILAFLFGCLCIMANGQIPQGFNYQAIARDGSGTVLSNQLLPVRISIQTSLTGGIKIWEETHTVTTNSFGIMVFVVGTGTRTGGSAALFSDINWSIQTLFLKTEIQFPGPGYSDMGTTQLWSVPYSMVANSLAGPVDKLGVLGTTDNMDEALFEVKNKTGQTVFAVYNEGVRVYVSDGISKGAKGGFAIGGFGGTKAAAQDYFVVKPDTIRMYIDDTPGKGAKGGFAIGGFGTSKGLSQKFLTVSQDSVRVYLDNTNTVKGAKGGFAIGGFGTSKGNSEEYLRVTRDSTRVYLNDTPGKGAKGGFAIGGFSTSKGSKKDYMSISPDSTNFYVRTLTPLSSSTFNIVGVDPTLGRKSLMKADKDTVSVSKVLALQKNLIVGGNLDVEGTFKQAPLVMTTAASSIKQNTATGGGNIVSNNGAAIILSGICWSTSPNPTVLLATKTTDGLALGPYTSTMTGLTDNTLYYVRAYATNSIGTSYGNEVSFTTLVIAPPELTTTAASSVSQIAASSGGNITNDGGTSVTSRGVCWNTSSNPTTANTKTTDGTGAGSFTSSITGLTVSTTYYLRSYATNSVGTSYGNEISFTTLAASVATITTTAATLITQTTAASGGNITYDGGAAITAKGVCWALASGPTISNSKTTDGTGSGVFVSSLSGLAGSTIYFVRAYATNSVGTAYGNEISFTTSAPITDIDGNTYNTVTIGTQTWMTENLKTTKYSDGTPIPLVTNGVAWAALLTPGYCWYNNDPTSNKDIYGAMYNWYAVDYASNGGKNICPTGWHVPGYDEVISLIIDNLGGESIAGGKLKETGTSHWQSPNTGATNETGFKGLPGGDRYFDGSFIELGSAAYFWTTKENSSTTADGWGMYSNIAQAGFFGPTKQYGYSVRCLLGVVSLPVVTTTAISAITSSTASGGGNITSNGGAVVSASGICWSYSANPTIALATKTTDGSALGIFVSNITGLKADTLVHVRAYATNSVGTSYGSDVTFKTLVPAIGASFRGGKLAYVLQPGDPGYISGQNHGLIAATSDQSTAYLWSNISGTAIGISAAGTSLGTGLTNSNAIIAQAGHTNSAAKLCLDLVSGGYSDWYLPSLDELSKLNLNRVAIGGFASDYYWSSSEYDSGNALLLGFGIGYPPNAAKVNTFHVRAVRSF